MSRAEPPVPPSATRHPGTVSVRLAAPPEVMAAALELLTDLLGDAWQPARREPAASSNGYLLQAGTLTVPAASSPDLAETVRAISELEKYAGNLGGPPDWDGNGPPIVPYMVQLATVEQHLTALRRITVISVGVDDVAWALHLASARQQAEHCLRNVDRVMTRNPPGSRSPGHDLAPYIEHLTAALRPVRRLLLTRPTALKGTGS